MAGKKAENDKNLVKIDYKILRLKDLIPTPNNPQKFTDAQFDGLVKSMKKDGWLLDGPVCWLRPDGKYQIISGHHRIDAGIKAGILETGCKIIEGIDEEKVLLKVLEANQRRGSFDDDMLNDFIDSISTEYDIDIDFIHDEIGMIDEFEYNPVNKEKEINGDVITENKCPQCGYEW